MRQNRQIIYAPSCCKRKRVRWRKREENFLWFVSAVNGDARELEPGSRFQFGFDFNLDSNYIRMRRITRAEFDKSDLCDTRVICVIQWRRESSSINVYVKVCALTHTREHICKIIFDGRIVQDCSQLGALIMEIANASWIFGVSLYIPRTFSRSALLILRNCCYYFCHCFNSRKSNTF